MYERIAGGIIIIAFSIVLLTQPWQLFVRNGSDMVSQVKSKPLYIKSLKFIGIILMILGVAVECSIFIWLNYESDYEYACELLNKIS